jgi:DNA-binding response OmpR family regulator
LTATDPEEALRLLRSITPDLILLDVNFPGTKMTGFTLFEEVRKMPEFARVPIVFITGLKDEESVRTGLQLGADDFITKPFSTPTLTALIEGKLKRYQEIKKGQ